MLSAIRTFALFANETDPAEGEAASGAAPEVRISPGVGITTEELVERPMGLERHVEPSRLAGEVKARPAVYTPEVPPLFEEEHADSGAAAPTIPAAMVSRGGGVSEADPLASVGDGPVAYTLDVRALVEEMRVSGGAPVAMIPSTIATGSGGGSTVPHLDTVAVGGEPAPGPYTGTCEEVPKRGGKFAGGGDVDVLIPPGAIAAVAAAGAAGGAAVTPPVEMVGGIPASRISDVTFTTEVGEERSVGRGIAESTALCALSSTYGLEAYMVHGDSRDTPALPGLVVGGEAGGMVGVRDGAAPFVASAGRDWKEEGE